MTDIWFTSDHHFGHENILKFEDRDGRRFRGELFRSVEEMDEHMVERWNSVVKQGDKVYHLGDIAFKVEVLRRVMPRLNGSKRWVVGNHDDIAEFARGGWFKKVYMWRVFKDEGFVATHVPLRPDNFPHGVPLNVHGHIHQNLVTKLKPGKWDWEVPKEVVDDRYMNVCVEQTNYTPVHMDEVVKRAKAMRDAAERRQINEEDRLLFMEESRRYGLNLASARAEHRRAQREKDKE